MAHTIGQFVVAAPFEFLSGPGVEVDVVEIERIGLSRGRIDSGRDIRQDLIGIDVEISQARFWLLRLDHFGESRDV